MNKENLAFLRLEVIEVHPAMSTPFGPMGPSVECRAINKRGEAITDRRYYFDAEELILPGAGIEELKALHAQLQAKK